MSSMDAWREGRRIVDLSELAKNMYCKRCRTVLDLNHTEREVRVGLASILYVECHCGMRNDVHTATKQQQMDGRFTYSINMIASESLVQCGMMRYIIQNVFTALKIPLPALPLEDLSFDMSLSFPDCLTSPVTFSNQLTTQAADDLAASLTDCPMIPSPTDCSTLQPSQPLGIPSNCSPDSVSLHCGVVPADISLSSATARHVSQTGMGIWPGLENDSCQQEPSVHQESSMANSTEVTNNEEANICGDDENDIDEDDDDDEEEEEEGDNNDDVDEDEDNEDNDYAVPVAFEEPGRTSVLPVTLVSSVHASKTSEAGEPSNGASANHAQQRVVVQNTAMILNSSSSTKPYGCGVCFKAYSNEEMCRAHIQTHIGGKPYLCEDCGRGFVCEYNLKLHKRQHTGERPYRCEDCGRGFIRWFTLKRHRQKHQDLVRFTCQVCGDAFSSMESLKRHRRVHTGEKPFSCDQCEKTFRGESNLYAHRRRHFGIKPYKCDHCDAAFVESTHLTRHRRTHTKEQPYICETCGARYTQSGSLAAHRKKHTGEARKVKVLQCAHCGKVFNSYTQLKRHKRVHTGERPYVCDLCQMAFTQSSSLKAHRRIHTGERPFKCLQCGDTFLYPRTLKRHVKKHADMEPT